MYKKERRKETWQILRQYESIVFGYLKNAVGDSQTAKDLFQDVYLSALQHLNQLDVNRSLKEWLLTVARNKVINYLKWRNKRRFLHLDEHILQSDMHSTAFSDAIKNAIDALPENQRNVFILRSLDGWSYKELAQHINISVSAVTSLLKRARDNFTRQYLMYHLPHSLRANADFLQLTDLMRFIDPFEAPDLLLERVQRSSQRYFNRIAEQWDEVRNRFITNQKLEEILQKLPFEPGELTFDLGSGAGFIAIHAALKGQRVVGVDMNKSMIRQTKSIKKTLQLKPIKLCAADIRRLPFKPSIADYMFINLVLHHVPNPPLFIKQTTKVLKRGGYFVVIDFMHHKNKEMADIMHDLWLGFNTDSLIKWAEASGLYLYSEQHWVSETGIEIFCHIYKKTV